MAFKKPTKQQLKEKYGISHSHFKILTEKPSPQRCEKRGITLREVVAWCFGVPTFLVYSSGGLVLAVLLTPNPMQTIQERAETFKGRIVMARDFMRVPGQHAPVFPFDDYRQHVASNVGTTSHTVVTFTDLTDGTSDGNDLMI